MLCLVTATPPTATPALPPTLSLIPLPAIAVTRLPPRATILAFAVPPIAVAAVAVTARPRKKACSVHYTPMATPPAVGTYSAAARGHGLKKATVQDLRSGNPMIFTIKELEARRATTVSLAVVPLAAAAAAAAVVAVAVAVAVVLARAIRARTRSWIKEGGGFGVVFRFVFFLHFFLSFFSF